MKFNISNITSKISVKESTLDIINLLENEELKSELIDYVNSINVNSDYSNLSIGVHGDVSPSNFIYKDDNVLSIVDFDNFKIDNPVRDLAELILTFSLIEYERDTSSIKFINGKLDLTLCRLILK